MLVTFKKPAPAYTNVVFVSDLRAWWKSQPANIAKHYTAVAPYVVTHDVPLGRSGAGGTKRVTRHCPGYGVWNDIPSVGTMARQYAAERGHCVVVRADGIVKGVWRVGDKFVSRTGLAA